MSKLSWFGRMVGGATGLLLVAGVWVLWSAVPAQAVLAGPVAGSAPAQPAPAQLVLPGVTATYTPLPAGTASAATVRTDEGIETRAPDESAPLNTPTPTRTPTPVNIGNFVWDDLDQDGRQDAGEPGLPGVTVQLWNAEKTQLIDSDVTDANGIYTVVAPRPMTVRVRVVLPNAGDDFSPKNQADGDDLRDSDINPRGVDAGFTDPIVLPSNLISTTREDAGIIVFRTPTPTRTPTPVNIGNFVWDDLDQDGRQDAGEPGLPGITVQLWNSEKTQLLDEDITDANGIYTVVAPQPMTVRVRVLLPNSSDGFSPKNQAGGDDLLDSDINPTGSDAGFTDLIVLPSNLISTTREDAGIIVFRTPTPTRTPTPVNIGNFVWSDLDDDGVQDAGEPGVEGITVQLWNANKTQLIDSDVTDANGIYTVTAPQPMSVRVRVILPAGAAFSPKDVGVPDTQDSDINPAGGDIGFTDVINIASNVISMTNVDAGLILPPVTPITLGDFVWEDRDGDGIQEADERPVRNVTVQLWNSRRTLVLDENITDVFGRYELIAPGAGTYYIFVVLPGDGLWYTVKNNPHATEATDSDINRVGENAGFSDAFRLGPTTTDVDVLDAGLVQSPPLAVSTAGSAQVSAAHGTLWLALAVLLMSMVLGIVLRRRAGL